MGSQIHRVLGGEMMEHAINLTHDGTLILRIPKGYKVDKVAVEEMGTDNSVEYQPTHPTPSNTLGALDCVERQKAIEAIEEMQKPIMRSNFSHEQFVFRGMSEARQAIIELPSVKPETCEGCKHLGKWENEVEYGYPSPCTRCKRRVGDHYER